MKKQLDLKVDFTMSKKIDDNAMENAREEFERATSAGDLMMRRFL